MYKEQLMKAIDQVIENKFERYEYCQNVKRRKKEAKYICLYGTGHFFEDYVQNINDFDYVCDSNSEKWGKTFAGRVCLSPEELEKLESVVVFIMVGKYQAISEMLTKKGIENYYFGDLFLDIYDEQYSPAWFENNRKAILETVDLFEDEWSKKVYTNVICNRIAPKYADMDFHDMEEQGEYFDTGIFTLEENECMVDAGAYNGDSIQAFLKATKGNFEAIYGFEFDKTNFNEMLEKKDIANDERIHLYQMGVSNKPKEMSIVHAGTGSYVTNYGEEKVELNPLDQILKDKKITFLKMDVEGSEMEGLEGAIQIIKQQHPKLAISVYHKLDDMWKIPQYIKMLNPAYKLYLRHHTAVAWDTDCYAYIEE